MTTPDKNRARAFDLTTAALQAAMTERWVAAGSALTAINTELGGAGVAYAIKALCDTLIGRERELTGTEDGTPIRPAWFDTDRNRLSLDADEVPVEARWAGRLIAARAAMDRDSYDALIAAVGTDGRTVAAHVSALLQMVALTLRELEEVPR
jgi:hypothetical protein